jgi:nitroimidazol reductase NimA-like FMN-containing flavoprotein (pyridoxamine 5'-phosphate oxidase superfamily)
MKPMRLAKQELASEHTRRLLETAFYGILATVSADGMPYGVPLNHVLADDKLYFHCAVKGHKLDNIRHNSKACFTVVGDTKMLPEIFTAHFESAIAFGTVRLLHDPADIARAVRLLCEKNIPQRLDVADSVIAGHLSRLTALEMTIEHLTGKASED